MHNDSQLLPNLPEPEPPKSKGQFFTPEEVAARDSNETVNTKGGDINEPVVVHHQNPQKDKKFKWPPSKKQWLIVGVVVLVLVIIGGVLAFMASNHKPTKYATNKPKVQAPITKPSSTVPSTLSGLPVPPAANQNPITAVMVENTPQARPQAGLSQAGVVFEALTEGGITRFMALFQGQLPTFVGPVRSARPYFLRWDLGFDAPYAHDGGSPQALIDIKTLGVKNLDYLQNPAFYHRISSRPAPHNLYTSIPGLIKLEGLKGWANSKYSGWPRKPDSPSKNPNATNISFNLSYSTYNVNYKFSPQTDTYNRYEGGAPQIDANTGKQLSPKVVVGLVVPWSTGTLDTTGAYYSDYSNVGSGQAYIFQDGTVTDGQWSKPSNTSPLTFTDSKGNPIKFNAGQTWITALASSSELTYN